VPIDYATFMENVRNCTVTTGRLRFLWFRID